MSEGARNGAPWRPYRYRGGDREPGPAELVAGVRARLAARGLAAEGRRCGECGYLLTARGHAVECGDGRRDG